MEFMNKVAIITGGASGFGLGMVKKFLQEGAYVVIVDINKGAGEKVLEEFNTLDRRLSFVHADVAIKKDVAQMIRYTYDKFGKIDILVNNAGHTHWKKPIMEVSEEEFDRIFDVNVKAIYLAVLEILPIFKKQNGGCIINTSSTAAKRPRPGLTIYNSSKGAVNTLTKSLAAELAPYNVRVNAVCPVIGKTGLFEAFIGGTEIPEDGQKYLSSIPLGRISTPEDVANAALFFAKNDSNFLTGITLEVDGGRCI